MQSGPGAATQNHPSILLRHRKMGPFWRRVPWCCEGAAVGKNFVPALRGGTPRGQRQPRGALRFPWAILTISLREKQRGTIDSCAHDLPTGETARNYRLDRKSVV